MLEFTLILGHNVATSFGEFVKRQILIKVTVVDEVWIAAGLLHREHPEAADFLIEEIVDRARREGLNEPLRPGVYVHVVLHCVANRQPNPGRYRMLFETSEGRRRLFRIGDSYHPARENSKITPDREDLPHGYEGLLNWYQDWCTEAAQKNLETHAFPPGHGPRKTPSCD